MNEQAFSVSRIAAFLDISGRTARRIIEAGDLKAHRIGRQWRVFEPDLKDYLARKANCDASRRPSSGGRPNHMTKEAYFRVGTPAAQPEVRLIDLRGPEGQLIRQVTQLEADRVVESGLGFRRGKHEVRLMAAAAHHDGNPRTWLGNQRMGRIRPSKYAHNQRVCSTWKKKQNRTSLSDGDNS